MKAATLKSEFINRFGAAYKDFGLPSLMGRVVGLLIYHENPLSLNDIASELGVSKGPVSQILHRLRDHELVKRLWLENDRKDYYRAVDHIFLQAFINQTRLFRKNLDLAKEFSKLASCCDETPDHFCDQLEEMVRFNQQMQERMWAFIESWQNQSTDQ